MLTQQKQVTHWVLTAGLAYFQLQFITTPTVPEDFMCFYMKKNGHRRENIQNKVVNKHQDYRRVFENTV